jgi:hypothetical protein
VLGEGINKSLPWDDVYAKGNGAAVRVLSVQGFTVRDVYAEFPWDGIKLPGSSNFTIEHCELVHTRDDAIENDSYGPGTVNNCFLNGVHTFLSANNSNVAMSKAWHMSWTNNVMSLGCGLPDGKPCEDRAKRLKYAWACPTGSGQPWKVRDNPGLFTMTFANNAAMIEGCINQTKANIKWWGGIKLTPESKNNRFYYLGTGKGFTMVEVTNADGSKARVPAEFGIAPGPVWARSATRARNGRPKSHVGGPRRKPYQRAAAGHPATCRGLP